MKERDIKDQLLALVASGFARKVKWENRPGAPDWVVCLPGYREVWLELKRPGLAAKFPANAHERIQHREHEKMRAAGMAVFVCDSEEGLKNAIYSTPLAAPRN